MDGQATEHLASPTQSCRSKTPSLAIAPWPGGRHFALFLSHDVDEIYGRELFRILGDINHLRRMWSQGEPGHAVPCIKRVARAVVRPSPPGQDIDTILAIERNAGLHSTFFLLEDRTFNRLGGRYRYSEPATRTIARQIERHDCELAVHGAYHAFNDPEKYRRQAHSFFEAFGREPRGIRNHFLRHNGEQTWRAQREAGFAYDASFGFNDHAGVRDGKTHPFFPLKSDAKPERDFVALPLTIMDSAIFRRMRLPAAEALALCERLIEQIRTARGLLCLSWHNNFFAEEEYRYWQQVYETLLGSLADQNAWTATGEEISDWWQRRARVLVERIDDSNSSDTFVLKSPDTIQDLVLVAEPEGNRFEIEVHGADFEFSPDSDALTFLRFPLLDAGAEVRLSLRLREPEA